MAEGNLTWDPTYKKDGAVIGRWIESVSGGAVSENNSSTVVLGVSEVFTGEADDVTQYSSISITAKSDVDSASSGLSLEFSVDGTNWDRKLLGHVVGTNSHIHTLKVINKFFRVVYTNGTTGQAYFRLQVLYHTTNSLPLINRSGQPQNTVDCIVTRPATDIDLDYARIHVNNARSFFFFGFNATVGTVYEDIHPAGGDINWLTAASQIEVISTNAADTSTGAGVRSVEVHGLSDTGADQSEVIDMIGASATTAATLTYRRINKMHNETVGTYGGSHQGNVTCQTNGAGTVLSIMTGVEDTVDSSVQYGSGESGNGYWSVPLGKVAYITRLEVIPDFGASSKNVDVALYEREGILTVSAPFLPRRVLWSETGVEFPIQKEFKSHLKIKELTDIFFRGKGTATSKIAVSLDFYLVDADVDGA